MTIIMVIVVNQRSFEVVYDPQVKGHLSAIEAKYNRFRVFYAMDVNRREVKILAMQAASSDGMNCIVATCPVSWRFRFFQPRPRTPHAGCRPLPGFASEPRPTRTAFSASRPPATAPARLHHSPPRARRWAFHSW